MDMSFMSKFLVQGKDAGPNLNYLSTANVDGDEGIITYTQWLNHHGNMEADLTVCKLSEDKFMVVATDTMHRHVESHMKKYFPSNSFSVCTDVTGAYAQLNIQGPKSRELLQKLTDHDVSNSNFPFRTAREISIGCANVLCVRITYLGELGYELYIPSENASHVYDLIVEKGEPLGLVHAGLKALSSLRLEKGYRDFGHDMDNTDSLLEVGLGFTADYEKDGGFIGKESTLQQKKEGLSNLKQRLVQVLVKDPMPLLYHGEVLYRNRVCVGDIRAGSYGHTLGGAIGLSMVQSSSGVTNKWIQEGTWEVNIAGKFFPAEVSLKPLYDSGNSKIKM